MFFCACCLLESLEHCSLRSGPLKAVASCSSLVFGTRNKLLLTTFTWFWLHEQDQLERVCVEKSPLSPVSQPHSRTEMTCQPLSECQKLLRKVWTVGFRAASLNEDQKALFMFSFICLSKKRSFYKSLCHPSQLGSSKRGTCSALNFRGTKCS